MPAAVFARECDMINPLMSMLPRSLPRPDRMRESLPRLLVTPSIGKVIPDLLIAVGIDDVPSALSSLTFLEATVLSVLANHPIVSCDDLLAILHIAPNVADRLLKRLLGTRLALRRRSGQLVPARIIQPNATRIFAVEVKLHRWREALAQALSYTRFANESYVVLDGTRYRDGNEIASVFASTGIGLVLQFDTSLELLVRAAPHLPIGPERFIALSKLARAKQRSASPS